MGHEIGLHFDETAYEGLYSTELLSEAVHEEARILEGVIKRPVKSLSMHQPSQTTLDADLNIEGMINSYCKKYFNEYKYMSDSRMVWREDVENMVASGKYDKLHILTHPFWYSDDIETTNEKIMSFCGKSAVAWYNEFSNNYGNILNYSDIRKYL
jgi:hypothetical protein